MNQSESPRKAEGSGVGILCVRGPLLQRAAPPPPRNGPRLQQRAYITAPDGGALTTLSAQLKSGRRADLGSRRILAVFRKTSALSTVARSPSRRCRATRRLVQ